MNPNVPLLPFKNPVTTIETGSPLRNTFDDPVSDPDANPNVPRIDIFPESTFGINMMSEKSQMAIHQTQTYSLSGQESQHGSSAY